MLCENCNIQPVLKEISVIWHLLYSQISNFLSRVKCFAAFQSHFQELLEGQIHKGFDEDWTTLESQVLGA